MQGGPEPQIRDILLRAPLFAAARPGRLARLVHDARCERFGPGAVIGAEGEAARVGVVVSGCVREGTIARNAGACFGLAHALIGEAPDAVAGPEGAEAVLLAAAAVRALLRSDAGAAFALAETLARESGRPVPVNPFERLYAELLRRARPDAAAEGGWSISPMPRHRDLAEAAGTSEETAAAAIAHLIQEGVVRRRYPDLEIRDRFGLHKLAGLG